MNVLFYFYLIFINFFIFFFTAETKLVRIGYSTNIQDGTVIEEVPEELGPDHDGSVIIGNWVTVGKIEWNIIKILFFRFR